MASKYEIIIEKIFFDRYSEGDEVVPFERDEMHKAAEDLGIKKVKNLGDVVYSFKYRSSLPESILDIAPEGKTWVIVGRGRAKYAFNLQSEKIARVTPDTSFIKTKIPDATPGIVARYAPDDEQALLAKLRYNRMIDIFTGVTCYSLQNHLRTTVPGIGQVETDEIYVGVDDRGAHYIIPVQAKGGNDEIGFVQLDQDLRLCADKYPNLIARSIAAQFIDENTIALFEFTRDEDQGVVKVAEKHYRLVPKEELTESEIKQYRQRALSGN